MGAAWFPKCYGSTLCPIMKLLARARQAQKSIGLVVRGIGCELTRGSFIYDTIGQNSVGHVRPYRVKAKGEPVSRVSRSCQPVSLV